jgi:hypothetical protein
LNIMNAALMMMIHLLNKDNFWEYDSFFFFQKNY